MVNLEKEIPSLLFGGDFTFPMVITFHSKKTKMVCNLHLDHLYRLTNFKITRFIAHRSLFEAETKTADIAKDISEVLFQFEE